MRDESTSQTPSPSDRRETEQSSALGDMNPEEFRRAGGWLVEWIARYLQDGERYPVLARTQPGDIRDALPSHAPEVGEPMKVILDDLDRLLVSGVTHWNHPAFFGYFPISGTGPGILAEFVTAALNQQGMLWRTSPVATELEEVALGWLRNLLGLPAVFEGVIYDGGSTSNLHGLMAARAASIPELRSKGLVGRPELAPMRIYCSEQAHSSIDKAAMVLGLGQDAVCKVEADEAFRMKPDVLRVRIDADRRAGVRPMAVVATVGTTSTSSIDPVPEIAEICEAERIWLHVDASYGGAAAILPECSFVFTGVARADSVVMNPHKWLFTPLDLSAFYCRRMDLLRASLALTPDYLETREAGVRNLMDTGVQLARRFRALKLWAVLRYFGAEGLRRRIGEHIRIAKQLAAWIEASEDFELLAPVPLSVVCFRARPRSRQFDASRLDELNAAVLERLNASGQAFLSHTRLNGRYALRMAICNIRTSESHVRRTWSLLQDCLAGLLADSPS